MTKRMLIGGLAVLAMAAGAAMGQVPKLAKVAHVEGQVEVISAGSRIAKPAEMGMTLFPGDQVRTRNGKCTLNFTVSGILRLSPGMSVLFPANDGPQGSMLLRMMAGKTVKNFRQLVGLDADEVFEVRGERVADSSAPAQPGVVVREARGEAAQSARGTGEDPAVAEYRQLLPAVLAAEKKPWHTRFEFLAKAVRAGTGYRVAYKTYCRIDTGPDAGKDYACYELDTVLDLGAIRTAVADMKRRLGR